MFFAKILRKHKSDDQCFGVLTTTKHRKTHEIVPYDLPSKRKFFKFFFQLHVRKKKTKRKTTHYGGGIREAIKAAGTIGGLR